MPFTENNGQLIIKEYPTASAHSNHFRGLIKELAFKKSFKPDIIFIDYLNICASSRFKANGNVNSYMYIKAIAEELRGLAVETNVPIMSATQTTRSGFSNSDVGWKIRQKLLVCLLRLTSCLRSLVMRNLMN